MHVTVSSAACHVLTSTGGIEMPPTLKLTGVGFKAISRFNAHNQMYDIVHQTL